VTPWGIGMYTYRGMMYRHCRKYMRVYLCLFQYVSVFEIVPLYSRVFADGTFFLSYRHIDLFLAWSYIVLLYAIAAIRLQRSLAKIAS